MDVLAGAKRAFVSVNVAGKVNDTWLDPEQQVLGGVQDALSLSLRRAQAPAGPRSLVQHIHQGSQYAAGYSFAWSRIALGTCLSLQRSIPPFWGGEAVLAKSVLSKASPWVPLYPVAEMLVGRGHAPRPIVLKPFNSDILGFFLTCHSKISQYGALGLIVEAAPLKLAARCEQHGYHAAATASMVAAVVGRSVLQPVRLLVCAAAILNEAFYVMLIVSSQMAIDVGLRGIRGGISLASKWLHRDFDAAMALVSGLLDRVEGNQPEMAAFLYNLPMTEIPANDRSIAPIGPDVHHRVSRRTNRLLDRFKRLQNEEDEGGMKRLEIAQGIAEDLRHYCSRQPNQQALRGGLRIVKDFIEVTWGEEVPFNPPELAG